MRSTKAGGGPTHGNAVSHATRTDSYNICPTGSIAARRALVILLLPTLFLHLLCPAGTTLLLLTLGLHPALAVGALLGQVELSPVLQVGLLLLRRGAQRDGRRASPLTEDAGPRYISDSGSVGSVCVSARVCSGGGGGRRHGPPPTIARVLLMLALL